MKTLLVTIIAVAVALILLMLGLGVKMLCRRSDEFHRPCVNADPKTGRCTHCTCKDKLKTKQQHHEYRLHL